jgi:protein gp37
MISGTADHLLRSDPRMIAVRYSYVPQSDPRWFIPNVWIGASVEDQRRADERVPLVAELPAAVRWLSLEATLKAGDDGAAARLVEALAAGRSPEHRSNESRSDAGAAQRLCPDQR